MCLELSTRALWVSVDHGAIVLAPFARAGRQGGAERRPYSGFGSNQPTHIQYHHIHYNLPLRVLPCAVLLYTSEQQHESAHVYSQNYQAAFLLATTSRQATHLVADLLSIMLEKNNNNDARRQTLSNGASGQSGKVGRHYYCAGMRSAMGLWSGKTIRDSLTTVDGFSPHLSSNPR